MVILNLEKYKSLKDEINRIKNGESNNKIEDIIIEMKKCIDFKEENKNQKLNQNVGLTTIYRTIPILLT